MAQETLLRNARVIDCISRQPRDGVSILIRGERIVKVDAQIDVGADTQVIDCTGKTLMPGLIDTHVHATMVDEIDLQLFLGAGVTTARDVGGKLDSVIALRGRLNSGAVLGPRLFVCGPLLDGRGDSFDHKGEFGIILDNVPDPASAPAKMNQLIDAGVDGIKLYFSMTSDIVGACIDAVARRVPVTGHLGRTTALEAVNLGIDGIEHMWITPYNDICPIEMRLTPDISMSSPRFSKTTFKGWEEADLHGPGAQALFGAMVDKQVKMGTTLDLLWLANIGLEAALADTDRMYIPKACRGARAIWPRSSRPGRSGTFTPAFRRVRATRHWRNRKRRCAFSTRPAASSSAAPIAAASPIRRPALRCCAKWNCWPMQSATWRR